MFSRLNVKLATPTAIVGVIFVIFILMLGLHESSTSLIIALILMIIAQSAVSIFIAESTLSSRLSALKSYLKKVISIDEAPDSVISDDKADELADITNELGKFISGLSDVIAEIRKESDSLKNGSEQLSQQMTESVHAVTESSTQIEQMATSIEEVASTSTILSDSAEQVSETTSQVMEVLAQGTASSDTSQKTIESFATEVNKIADDLALLQEESARIGSVLDVIRGIAEQTNLLALNAAIEAARAGEQGRGFAVVADEVRALAHRTQESTVEIQSMVEGLQEKSSNAVSGIEKGKSLTIDSLEHSREVVEALEKIGDAFANVDNLTSQIASGTEEQQRSTSSINSSMSAVVQLSQEINQGLSSVSEHAESQHRTTEEVDNTLNKICV